MTDSSEKQRMASLGPALQKLGEIIDQSTKIEDGTPTRYHLKPKTNSHDESEPYRKINYGERDATKPHKTVLMVGETGTGKTKLINAMVNYMLDVQREDKVWFEITDDDQRSVHSQTSIITVYGFYLQESKTDLTIIDTPGYGDTRGVEKDKEIGMSLLKLSRFNDWGHKVDAVCLVIKASQNRLSDRQMYIFDAVQSLFGRDIAENIVLLFTYSRGSVPKSALTAVEEAKVKCAVNEQNQPVYFLFDNCQGETFPEEHHIIQEQSGNLSFRGMEGFFRFLDKIKPKPLQMTRDVLQQREQLEENILKIKSIDFKCNENVEVEVTYKEKVDIDRSKAKQATCCSVCEENCHYPGCWWASNLSWCSSMKDDHCTVCTNKCHYSKHVKGAKIYQTKTKKEKRRYEELKKNDVIIGDGISTKKLVEELQELKSQKIKQVMEAFHCVNTLKRIALNTDSLITLLHVDFLIEKMKEIKEPEKVETLENIKKRAGEDKNNVLQYMKMYYR